MSVFCGDLSVGGEKSIESLIQIIEMIKAVSIRESRDSGNIMSSLRVFGLVLDICLACDFVSPRASANFEFSVEYVGVGWRAARVPCQRSR